MLLILLLIRRQGGSSFWVCGWIEKLKCDHVIDRDQSYRVERFFSLVSDNWHVFERVSSLDFDTFRPFSAAKYVKTGLFVRSFHWRCTRSYQIENEDTKTGYKIELQRDMQVTTVSDIV